MMTLLQLAQEFCKRQSLPIPTTVSGAQDDVTNQIWGLLNEGIADLGDRCTWQQQQLQTPAFGTVSNTINGTAVGQINLSEQATTTSGLASGSICLGFKAMVPRTMWETTTRLPVSGPLTSQQRVQILTYRVTPAQFAYWLQGDILNIYPYTNSSTFTFAYLSRFMVGASSGSTQFTEMFVNDGDTCLLPQRIMLQDLKWRWRKEKGLPYAEDQRILEGMVVNGVGREPEPEITLDNYPPEQFVGPGLLVPAGTWNVH